jgi:hypothetical protein
MMLKDNVKYGIFIILSWLSMKTVRLSLLSLFKGEGFSLIMLKNNLNYEFFIILS